MGQYVPFNVTLTGVPQRVLPVDDDREFTTLQFELDSEANPVFIGRESVTEGTHSGTVQPGSVRNISSGEPVRASTVWVLGTNTQILRVIAIEAQS